MGARVGRGLVLRFPRSRGTGPRATIKNAILTGGRGPVPRQRPRTPTIAGDRPPRYVPGTPNSREIGPRPTIKNAIPHRRAWALACHTRRRAGSPRQRPRTPTRAGDRPPRYGPGNTKLAGDRPPPYDKKRHPHRRAWALACHTRRRAGFPRQRPRTPTLAGDRPPRYGPGNTKLAGDRPPRYGPGFSNTAAIAANISATSVTSMHEYAIRNSDSPSAMVPMPCSARRRWRTVSAFPDFFRRRHVK